ncbi:MAG: hypothetical protein EBY16_08830 [Gammaproteobacteria bacterium]|nr:hypothetical protein [Gammaproteobacteria bacterium]
MSKKKGIICIGVSYAAPYFYLAGFSFASSFQGLFLNKTLSFDTRSYPSAIWVTSLPYASFHIHELSANQVQQTESLQNHQIQYLGLKNGIHFWQSCAIQTAVLQEQLNILGNAKDAMHVLELDLVAIWEYAFIKTSQPFKIRLLLWHKEPYLIGMLGRESLFWKVWYWSIDSNWWQEIQATGLPMPELISCLSSSRIECAIPVESIIVDDDVDYALAIALAHRGIRHAL